MESGVVCLKLFITQILLLQSISIFIYALHFDSIFLGPAINEFLVDYAVIDETDPYYWSINEFDMLSNFNHEIAV